MKTSWQQYQHIALERNYFGNPLSCELHILTKNKIVSVTNCVHILCRRAYNKMVYNDWEESEKYLKRLHELRSTDSLEMTCEKINLRLR